MEIKCIDDVVELLQNDVISNQLAIKIICTALSMIYIGFNKTITKDSLIAYLNQLKQYDKETPLFFGLLDLDTPFEVKDIINKNQLSYE